MGNNSSLEVKGEKSLDLKASACGSLISTWLGQFGQPLSSDSKFLDGYYDKDYFSWVIRGGEAQSFKFEDLAQLFSVAAQLEQIPHLQSPITCKSGMLQLTSPNPGVAVKPSVKVEIFTYQLKMSDGEDGSFHRVEDVFDIATKKCVCSIHTPYLPDQSQLAKAAAVELEANLKRSFAVQRIRDEFVPQYGKLTGDALRQFTTGFMDENIYTCSFMEIQGKPQTFEYKNRAEATASWEKATERKTVIKITKWVSVEIEPETETVHFMATFNYPSGTVLEFHGFFTFDRQTRLYMRGVWYQTKTAAAQWIEKPGDAAFKRQRLELQFGLANSFAVKRLRDEYIPNYGKLSGAALEQFLSSFTTSDIYSSTTLHIQGQMKLYERKTRVELKEAIEKVVQLGGTAKILNYNQVISADPKTESVDFNSRISYPNGKNYDFQCMATFDKDSKLMVRSVWKQLLEPPPQESKKSAAASVLGVAGSVLSWYGRQVSKQWDTIQPMYQETLDMNYQMIVQANESRRIQEARDEAQRISNARHHQSMATSTNNGYLPPGYVNPYGKPY